jgi:predicted RNA-binding protein with PIN domain
VVVFDGGPPAPGGEDDAGQIRFVFSRAPETADDVIMRLSAEWREGAVVVSSDRTIRQAASRVGSPVLTVTEFVAALRSGVAGAEDAVEDDDDPAPRDKRGNPRRLSREERAAQRALRRLRGSP